MSVKGGGGGGAKPSFAKNLLKFKKFLLGKNNSA